jgi:replicative DNA helicase
MRELATMPDPTSTSVLALDEESMKLAPRRITNAFATGVKPVFRLRTKLGRTIRATGNHRFRTIDGWRRLDELDIGDAIAVPRNLVAGREAPSMARPALVAAGTTCSEMPAAVDSAPLARLAASDLHWDPVVAVEPDGVEEVFDLTIEGLHNFVADDIVVHNSIEQDADIVSFIYRDEYYKQDESDRPGEADLIIAKHRNGPIGTVALAFQEQFPKFVNLASSQAYAGEPEAESGEAA